MKLSHFSYFSVANLVLCVGALGGVGVWQSSNDIFTLSSSYGFYWFMSIATVIFGIIGCLVSFVEVIKNVFSNDIDEMALSMSLVGLSFVGSICWFATFVSIAVLCGDCVRFKDNRKQWYLDYNCDGEIVSTTFSGALFLLWVSYLACNCIQLYKHTSQQEGSVADPIHGETGAEMQEVTA